tara:strand:+ start:90 stop:581 length:492 start_codon:yes stop_codon:yes gene_type:complete
MEALILYGTVLLLLFVVFYLSPTAPFLKTGGFKMSDNNQTLKNLLNFGVNLKLDSEEENRFYALSFSAWMMQQEDFDSAMISDEKIEIYYYAELVMVVEIKNSTLTLEPITESCFEAVMMVLKFISERHELTRNEYSRLSIREVNLEEQESEEQDSEDESEWI